MKKIAVIHDHLVQNGGAEKVVKAILELYPDSPLYTLAFDKGKIDKYFLNKNIKTSFLQNIPFSQKYFEWFLMFMPIATENHNLNNYDVVISSTSFSSKGVITRPETIHICYCHTPTRFLWTDSHNYLQELKNGFLIKKIVPLVLPKLRLWDRIASDRVDYYIANSQEVKKRIKKYYNKDSRVIYPPVDTHKFYISPNQGDYFLAGGRLVGYKKFDLVMEAFNRLNLPLKIFGTGPQLKKLKKIAKSNIEFLGNVSDKAKRKLYAECKAFINPQLEDFGITAIEAMASGRPVIAFKSGGALETVVENKTGLFFAEQTWSDLADVVLRFDVNNFDAEFIKNYAEKFNKQRFSQELDDYVKEVLMEKYEYSN